VYPKVSHDTVSEQDYLVLLDAGLGIGLLPESAVRSTHLTYVAVNGLALSRTVSACAVRRTATIGGGQRLHKAPPGR
jgi:hypothetical protein